MFCFCSYYVFTLQNILCNFSIKNPVCKKVFFSVSLKFWQALHNAFDAFYLKVIVFINFKKTYKVIPFLPDDILCKYFCIFKSICEPGSFIELETWDLDNLTKDDTKLFSFIKIYVDNLSITLKNSELKIYVLRLS